MQGAAVQLVSVSCPATGANQDCSILVLLQYIGNFRQDISYDAIRDYIASELANFGIQYSDEEQIGIDSFEGALSHFLPDYEVELYHVVFKPNQVFAATLRVLNKGARNKSPYRLALVSSWDRKRNTTGAGHFTLLNTALATPKQILVALHEGNFEQERFSMQSCIHCSKPAFLQEKHTPARIFCNIHCQAKHK